MSSQAYRPHYFPSEGQVRAARRPYLEYLPPAGRVLDLGCGRGEFLELLRESGRQGVGVESDPALVGACRSKGLKVEQCDGLEFLRDEAADWDGIIISHLIEHLPSSEVYRLLAAAADRLRSGGRLIVLTPNPNFLPGVGAFWSDMTHVRPYPLAGLRSLFADVGLNVVAWGVDRASRLDVSWRHPYKALVNRTRLLLLRLIMLEDYDGGEIFIVGERK